ncbi:MAG: hypothetical protein G01um101448_289 [Parcubacteria group bacterium Gr01-1014_48]|nr:MAG: hypothetical protein Greene041614_607 [Parcubacteria group bacterium Greene0416_14]TSC74179.1 MAG: hypothetical protein G01um101448_289 [Parcubacteria group bacterium Gr01-1014_48]TSD00855.1 MAG: hypothetical protein Greene101415_656 [Parcubacteria group bacterium Greene1014_15]TSD07937.1 MAG: hypothetical protein Greene07144_567 [Parcubacteria group bacterium Greene0714_4]
MRNIALGVDGRLPKEYETPILDKQSRQISCIVYNGKGLHIAAFVVSADGSIVAKKSDSVLDLPVEEALRLIMEIANTVSFSDALNTKTNEALTAIEIIARHAISSCSRGTMTP